MQNTTQANTQAQQVAQLSAMQQATAQAYSVQELCTALTALMQINANFANVAVTVQTVLVNCNLHVIKSVATASTQDAGELTALFTQATNLTYTECNAQTALTLAQSCATAASNSLTVAQLLAQLTMLTADLQQNYLYSNAHVSNEVDYIYAQLNFALIQHNNNLQQLTVCLLQETEHNYFACNKFTAI